MICEVTNFITSGTQTPATREIGEGIILMSIQHKRKRAKGPICISARSDIYVC